jgi:hypothetical protein
VGDLEVDLALLEQTATELGLLIEELNRAGDIARDGEDAVGAPSVRSALHGFVSDWQVHRKDLPESMHAVYQMAWTGHDAYQQADTQLALDIRVEATTPKGPR